MREIKLDHQQDEKDDAHDALRLLVPIWLERNAQIGEELKFIFGGVTNPKHGHQYGDWEIILRRVK